MLFAIHWRWFPVICAGTGDTLLDRLRQMALPTLALALIMMAYITRVTRSAMLEVLSQDYVRTARAKGASQAAVVWKHALGNCTIPITTVVGLYLGILIGNSVLTEIVFSRPGLGKLILSALAQRDYTLLQGMIVVYTLMVIVVNLATDLTYGLLDPRVQYK
jgi:peptide/nickel transport system permease protein